MFIIVAGAIVNALTKSFKLRISVQCAPHATVRHDFTMTQFTLTDWQL